MTTHSLGALQLAIMRVLWRDGEATASRVHQSLHADRGLAPTTIATMLKKMEHKGVVEHRAEGRRFIYVPLITEDQVQRSMVAELKALLFGGKTADLVTHLLSEHEVDADELDQLRAVIEDREKKGSPQ